MHLAEYVGQKLKSDSVIEILEHFDMQVLYDFDRLHENTPDSYSSSAREAGFELRFNEEQILDTIWCYIEPRFGFSPVDKEIVGAPILESFLDARSYAHESGVLNRLRFPRHSRAVQNIAFQNRLATVFR